ncbi:hypothetical protein ACH3XW_3780 [Acanthocheilonema viteae]
MKIVAVLMWKNFVYIITGFQVIIPQASCPVASRFIFSEKHKVKEIDMNQSEIIQTIEKQTMYSRNFERLYYLTSIYL